MAFSIYTGDQRADILGLERPGANPLKTMIEGILSPFWKNPSRRPETVILMAWQAEIKDIKNKIYDVKRLAPQTKKAAGYTSPWFPRNGLPANLENRFPGHLR